MSNTASTSSVGMVFNNRESLVKQCDNPSADSFQPMYPTTTVVVKSAETQTDGSRMQFNQETQRYDDRLAAKYFQFVQLNYGKMRKVSQDGKINRPTPSVVGFLEDYAEFMFDTSEGRENHSPSYLESTVDGSLIKGARRSHTSRVSTQDLDFFIDTVKSGTKEQDPLIALEMLGLKTEVHKYKCSKCVFESQSRSDVEDHMMLAGSEHLEAVVEVLLGNEARGKTCPLCSTKLKESQLFKHIRCCHKSNFPLRCGYCVFLGQDYNQLRHHIKKKHKTSNYQIIDVRHILAQIENPGTTEGGTAQDEFTGSPNTYQEFVCPVCDETLKTLSNLKKHIMKHSRKKQKCMLCPFTTSHPRQIRRHYERKHPTQTPQWETKLVEKNTNGAIVEDVTPVLKLITAKYGLRQPNKMKGWIRQYRCPHCDYTCNFNSSYNRHIRIHKGIKPFKCGHCDFHAREAYVVRKHSTKAHKGTPIVIESGKTFKAPYRYSYRKLKADQPSEFRIPTLADSWTLSVPSATKMKNSPRKGSLQKITERQDIEKCTEGNEPQFPNVTESRTIPVSTSAAKNYEPRKKKLHTNQWQMSNRCTSDQCMLDSIKKSSYDEKIKHLKQEEMGTTKQNRNTEVDENSLSLIVQKIPSTCNIVDGPSTDIEIPVMQNGQDRKCGYDGDRTNSSDDSCKLSRTLVKKYKTEQKYTYVCDSHCQIYLVESDFNSFPSSVIINFENANLLDPVISQPLVTQEGAGNAAITKGSDSTGTSVSTETDIYKRISIVSVQSTTLPTVSEPVYSGVRSDSQVQNTCNENSKLSTINIQENIYKEETLVEIENGIPYYPQQTDNNIHTLFETEANDKKSVEKSQPLSVIGAREYGEKNLQKSRAKTEVNLENNLHTHIAFLVDSREQQRSNTVSVSPGFITRDLLGLDYSNNDYFSSETVRNMMKRKKDGQATCIVCGVTTTYRAFYKHAKKHFNMKPFKCGYCSYRSIEKSKIRVHNTFCHSNKPCIIQKLSPENAALQHAQVPIERCSAYKSILTSHASFITENEKGVVAEKNESNSECSKASLLSVVDTISSEPYHKVSKTSETIDEGQMTTSDKATLSENSNNNLICSSDKPSKDPTHRSQMYKCSVCSKLMKKHTPSVRRHLYSHFKYKPYKCGYCSFTGSGPTEVRAHHVTHGSTVPPKVEHEIIEMPAELASLVKNIFSHQRGKSTRSKRKQASQRSSPRATESGCAYRRPEVTATHSSKQDVCMTWQKNSENLLVAAHQQDSKKASGDDLTLTLQTKERRKIASETECAVKALESDDITSGSLPSHINFKKPTESHSDVDSDPVCVVYLLDGRVLQSSHK
ncbi:hypothetical protein Pmani_032854 [Petrolisthes manimaculis]|uniref:C2H2-type domain-containing protein n=1 Tax=Petrolisthes manimaculis TaxID=1843537 RepID=A0AAE1TR13_9EUCA|nr:hypothetical protein Pmani_032854 [Petrolisthes manimaculis]